MVYLRLRPCIMKICLTDGAAWQTGWWKEKSPGLELWVDYLQPGQNHSVLLTTTLWIWQTALPGNMGGNDDARDPFPTLFTRGKPINQRSPLWVWWWRVVGPLLSSSLLAQASPGNWCVQIYTQTSGRVK